MEQKNAILIIAVCLIGAACSKAPEAPADVDWKSVNSTRQQAGPSGAAAAQRFADLPAPDRNRPLQDYEVELKKRAAQGDPLASCRLASEYDYCEGIQQKVSNLEAPATKFSGSDSPATGNATLLYDQQFGEFRAAFASLVHEQAKHCQGVVVPPPNRRIQYWRQAANAGHIPSMSAYATGRVFQFKDTVQNLEELRIYKTEALAIAKKAAQHGSLDAILALAAAYSPREFDLAGSSLLAQVASVNPTEALALYLQAQSVVRSTPGRDAQELAEKIERNTAGLIARLSPDDVRQAHLEAENRRSSWLPVEPMQGRSLGLSRDDGVMLNKEARLCSARSFSD